MPDIQFWDDKLTEEVQVIQLLVSSRDAFNANAADDDQVDKLLRDANRTRRCLRSQTKMLKKDDPTRQHCSARLQLLDAQLSALEQDWQSVDRSYSDHDEEEDESAASAFQKAESLQSIDTAPSTNDEYSKELLLDDTQTTSSTQDETILDDSSTQQSLAASDNSERRRPTLVRSVEHLSCGAQGRPKLERAGGERLGGQPRSEKEQTGLLKRFRAINRR